MKCDEYQKLLHFNRPGELDESQSKMLEEHVKVCERCLEKQYEIKKADAAITRLREMKPVLSEPAKLTNEIMSKIETSAQKEEKGFNKLIDAILDLLTLYQVRVTLSLITIFLVGTFLIQQVFVLNQVTKLENRIASGQAVSNKYYALKSSELASIFDPSEPRSLVNVLFKKDVKSSNDLIYLKKSTVKSWMKKLDKKENKILTSLFGKKFLSPEDNSLLEALDKAFAKKNDIIDLYIKQFPNWRK